LFNNEKLDLVVTVTSGDYTDITDVWISRDKVPPNGNGLRGSFGSINLQTVQGLPKSGEGNFEMCIVKQDTYEPVTLEQFSWTIYDLDERGSDEGTDIVVKERFIMDVGQAKVYQLVTNTKVQLSCEDGSAAPCLGGVRTIFHSSEAGNGGDNPSNPNDLTPLQKQRSVSFTFANTSCWQFTYDHYCPVEQPGYTGNIESCKSYRGGNFLFAGESEEIIEDGECLTPSPTPNPTAFPTSSPSSVPTGSPSHVPTDVPTGSPSHVPTDVPTGSPSHVPTGAPSNNPSASGSPSSDPSGSPSSDPTGSPSLNPTTLSPTTSPSIPPPACPEDVTIIKTDGITKIDAGQAVRILEQDTTFVTVRLYQGWTSSSSTDNMVDRIYYTYKHSTFGQKCHEAEDVGGLAAYEDITILCYKTKAFAQLDICVADNGGALDPEGDNAEIPNCCYPDLPDGTPVVCYKFIVNCDSVCADAVDVERRALRGTAQESPPGNVEVGLSKSRK
jgi:hypothetical protein